MTILHFGVTDLAYADGDGKTTGDVAEILEAKYHVMQTFYDMLGEDVVAKALERSVANAVEAMMMGSNSASINLTAEAEGEIEAAFRLFLSQQEMDGIVGGVPTQAALNGVSHRFKHPYAKRPARPSFIDTGQYQASMKAWMDGS